MRGHGNVTFLVALACLMVWLWHPVFRPVHVEGFSASILSIAIHLNEDSLANYDHLYAFNREFFALSRLGMNLAVASAARALGRPEDLALTVVMILSFTCLVGSSAILIRRWGQVSFPLALAALVLIPGVAESAFFYNDNVLSAALATSAMAVLSTWRHVLIAALGGVLFGFAILTRTDAVLLAPAAALILIGNGKPSLMSVWRMLGFGAATASVVSGVLLIFGVGPFGLLHIASYAVALWDRGPSLKPQIWSGLYFAGIPCAVLMVFGFVRLARQRDIERLLLLVGVPLLFNLIYLGKMWQSRQFLLLTPFVAALAVQGIRLLVLDQPIRVRPRRRIVLVAALAATLTLPAGVRFSDGPQMLTGHIWGPVLWSEWQTHVKDDLDRMRAFIDGIGEGRTIVVTDQWNADRYFHLSLQKAGYKMLSPKMSACSRSAEQFRKDGHTIVHVRLHMPFLRAWETALPARYDTYLAPCLVTVPASQVQYLASIDRIRSLFGPSAVERKLNDAKPMPSWLSRPTYEAHAYIKLDEEKLAELRRGYEAHARLGGNEPVRPDGLARLEQRLWTQVGGPVGQLGL